MARIDEQLEFFREMDALKRIERRNLIGNRSRRENSAEHSWHLAMMTAFLAEYSPDPVDISRATKMALIHDVVEIDAGDTFVYGTTGQEDKEERENAAAERLFALLPEDQRDEVWSLFREMEGGRTPEARLVRALDRVQPILLHQMTGGDVWQEHEVTKAQVLSRVDEVRRYLPQLWPFVLEVIERAVEEGKLRAQ